MDLKTRKELDVPWKMWVEINFQILCESTLFILVCYVLLVPASLGAIWLLNWFFNLKV